MPTPTRNPRKNPAAPAGYSGTPLATKLGLKRGMRLRVVGEPRPYARIVADLPEMEFVGPRARNVDVVHLFTTRARELGQRLPRAMAQIARAGAIWVSWPKKASGVETDVTEDVVREFALPLGLVDVKVCAVDETWSGLKLVIRRSAR